MYVQGRSPSGLEILKIFKKKLCYRGPLNGPYKECALFKINVPKVFLLPRKKNLL